MSFTLFWFTSCGEKGSSSGDEEKPPELTDEKLIELHQKEIVRNILDTNGMQSRTVDEFASWNNSYIEKLDLSNTQVNNLPNNISELKKLKTLILDNIFLTALPDSIILDTNLTKLSLKNTRLKTLPDSLHFLFKLTYLDLSQNKLDSIPEEISKFDTLVYLNLEENNLIRTPRFFRDLKYLKTLKMNRNNISELPEDLGSMEKLEILEFSHNSIRRIPNSIGDLKDLYTLEFINNEITDLPPSIINLTSLYNLSFDYNNITDLPNFITLGNLSKLSFSNNNINRIPDDISTLSSLQELYIQYNNIRLFPPGISELTNLRTLLAENNNIEEIPYSFVNFKNLETLNLRKNRILIVPENISNINLKNPLIIDGNPDFCAVSESQKTFIISKTSFTTVEICPDSILTDSVYTRNSVSDYVKGRVLINDDPLENAQIFLFNADNKPLEKQPEIFTDEKGEWTITLNLGMFSAAAYYLDSSSVNGLTGCYNQFIISGGSGDTLHLPSPVRVNKSSKSCNDYIPYPGTEFIYKPSIFKDSLHVVTQVHYPIIEVEAKKVLKEICGLPDDIDNPVLIDQFWQINSGKLSQSTSEPYYQFSYRVSNQMGIKTVYCNTRTDSLDNDGDGCIDEEIPDGRDNDMDGYIDEDNRYEEYVNINAPIKNFFHPESIGGDLATLEGRRLAFTMDSNFWIPGGNTVKAREDIFGLKIPLGDTTSLLDSAIKRVGGCWSKYFEIFGDTTSPGTEFIYKPSIFKDSIHLINQIIYPLDQSDAKKVLVEICNIPTNSDDPVLNGSFWEINSGKISQSTIEPYYEYSYRVSNQSDLKTVYCEVRSDSIDNDGDGCIDEEIPDSLDNDLDGFIDEDTRYEEYVNSNAPLKNFFHPESINGDTAILVGRKLAFTMDSNFWIPGGNTIQAREDIIGLNIPLGDTTSKIDSAINRVGGCWSKYSEIFGN